MKIETNYVALVGVRMKRGREKGSRKKRGAPDAETIKKRAENKAAKVSAQSYRNRDALLRGLGVVHPPARESEVSEVDNT